jgi:hypothetical protein
MSFDAQAAIARLLSRLCEVGTPERAAGEKRYLKSDLEFLGVAVWQTRREARALVNDHPALTHDQLTTLVRCSAIPRRRRHSMIGRRTPTSGCGAPRCSRN